MRCLSLPIALVATVATALPVHAATNATEEVAGIAVEDSATAAKVAETPTQCDARMQGFRDAKFGMFIQRSSASVHDQPADHPKLFRGAKTDHGFALHTGDEMNSWVQIDLSKVLNVTGLIIENRPGERRTDGLTLSISDDAHQWTRVWTAPKWEQTWEVPVMTTQAGTEGLGCPARYLKLKTNPAKPAPMLHQRVEIYGK